MGIVYTSCFQYSGGDWGGVGVGCSLVICCVGGALPNNLTLIPVRCLWYLQILLTILTWESGPVWDLPRRRICVSLYLWLPHTSLLFHSTGNIYKMCITTITTSIPGMSDNLSMFDQLLFLSQLT